LAGNNEKIKLLGRIRGIGKVIKVNLKYWDLKLWIGLDWLRAGLLESCCEHGN
jgi:hypothetical protein